MCFIYASVCGRSSNQRVSQISVEYLRRGQMQGGNPDQTERQDCGGFSKIPTNVLGKRRL